MELLTEHAEWGINPPGLVNWMKAEQWVSTLSQFMTKEPNRTILQNIYSADIVSWLAQSVEQTMNLYNCGINLLIFNIFFNKYIAMVIIMHIASNWTTTTEYETISNHVISVHTFN